jgi:uncharacterized protein (TIGR02453 family)
MIKQTYFDFFEDLARNNNSEWFNTHKKRYEKEVKEPFIQLVEAIVAELKDSEPELALVPPKQMLFRINRDIRFSKDKRPYKEHMGAIISRYGTKDKIYPGHYLQLSAGESFLAGGAYWFEEKDMLKRVRQYIADNPERFAALLSDANFVAKWGTIKGEKNKRVPPEFAESIENQPLIANTQFYWSVDLDPKLALQPDFVSILRGYFVAAQPMNEFFLSAMYG